jgi:hypothetical protein
MWEENNDGIVASSAIWTEWNNNDSSEQTVPYSRFKKVNDRTKDLERKIANLESKFSNNTANIQDEVDYEKLTNLSPAEFAKAIEEQAYKRALKSFEDIQNKNQSEIQMANQLLDEWFDYLRDSWHKITSSVEKELAEIALDYNINLEEPKDFEKIYKLYNTINKTKWTWNSSQAETIGTQQKKNVGSAKIATNGSWSDVVERIKAQTRG